MIDFKEIKNINLENENIKKIEYNNNVIYEKNNNVIFYDACNSSSGLINYGNPIPINPNTLSETFVFEYKDYWLEDMYCYVLAETTYTGMNPKNYVFVPINKLTGEDNFVLTCEIKMRASIFAVPMVGLCIIPSENEIENSYIEIIRYCNGSQIGLDVKRVKTDNTQSLYNHCTSTNSNVWTKWELIIQNGNFEINVYDLETGLLYDTYTDTISSNVDGRRYGLVIVGGNSGNWGCYRNIKAERLEEI